MPRNDGGPAFPTPREDHSEELRWTDDGMSLRDWFAGQAPPMPEWWADLHRGRDKSIARSDAQFQARSTLELMALWAFCYADAMLAAREEARDG